MGKRGGNEKREKSLAPEPAGQRSDPVRFPRQSALTPRRLTLEEYERELEARVARAETREAALENALRAWLLWDGAEAAAGGPSRRDEETIFGLGELYQRARNESEVALGQKAVAAFYPQKGA